MPNTKVVNRVVLILIAVLSFSCSRTMNEGDYSLWMKDYSNNFHVVKTVGELKFDLQYKTPELVALMERRGEISDASEFKKRVNALKGMDYFTLTVSVNDAQRDLLYYKAQNQEDYVRNLNYCSFNFQNDIFLNDTDKNIPCTLYHFERTYNLKNSRVFVLGFPVSEKITDKTFIIDSEWLSVGVVKIKFSEKDFRNIPELKF